MSHKLNNQSRRNFLKGAAYTSALSIAGITSLSLLLNEEKGTSVGSMVHVVNDNKEVVC